MDVVASDQKEIQKQLAKILSSSIFEKSPQLSRFLRFCVEQTLLGRADSLKEQVLGAEVFRRPSPFDPRLDPIVRVEARRLRSKLDQYYSEEGGGDPVIITFLRGDYIPRFVHASPRSDVPVGSAPSARVLIVEDEFIVARDLSSRLKNLGYTVVGTVASGEDALRAVENDKPDIVLMDIVLTGTMRGTDVARRIWDDYHVPVVYLTGFSDPLVLEDVKGSQPYGYILKPFDPKQLNAVLQIALSRRTRERQDIATGREKARLEALRSALKNARIGFWDWVIHDPSLPFPENVSRSTPVLSDRETPPHPFLEGIFPADKERVAAAFTDAIRNRTPIDISYRRGDPEQDGAEHSEAKSAEWAIAVGRVAEHPDGALRYCGVEIGAGPGMSQAEAHDLTDLHELIMAAEHDVAEPLAAIKAYVQLLSERSSKADVISESILQHLNGDVERLQALISDLVAYAKLIQQDGSTFEYVNAESALNAAIQNLETTISSSRATITTTEMPALVGSKAHIVQVFQNLLAQFLTQRNGQGTPTIHVSAVRLEGQWQFSIRPDGPAREELQIQEKPESVDAPASDQVQGSELALAICRRIIENHGGEIWTESAGQGESVFYFTLPAAPEGMPSRAA